MRGRGPGLLAAVGMAATLALPVGLRVPAEAGSGSVLPVPAATGSRSVFRATGLSGAGSPVNHSTGGAQAGQHLQRGVQLLSAGRLEEAIAELRQAVALQPGDPTARYQLGLALFTAGQAEAAVEHLQAAVEGADEPGAVHFLLGQVLLETGDLEGAHASLGAAASSRPGYPPIDFYRAELCYRLGRVEAARQTLAALSAAAPEWPAPVLRSGTLALEAGDTSEAVRWFEALVELTPDDPVAWMRLATARVEDEQPYRALAAYRRAAEVAPDYLPARVAVAVQLINLDEHEEAMDAIEAVLARDPDHGVIRYHRARLLQRSGDPVAALAEVETALGDLLVAGNSRVAGPGGVPWSARAAQLRAEMLLEVGRIEEAIEAGRRLIADHPDYPEALFFLGNALIRQSDPSGQELLRRFRTLSDAREQRQLGDQLRLREGDLERARRAYAAALEIVPDDAGSLLGLGAVQRQAGAPRDALETLAAARQAGAGDADWHREWVLALFDAGRRDEARAAWAIARAAGLTLGPSVWEVMHEPLGGC